MIGLGTIINTVAVIVGGFIGLFGGSFLKERHQRSLTFACGVSVLFISIAGGMEGMLTVDGGIISAGRSMFVTICILLGAVTGELINIEGAFERFGEWLKIKSGNAKDARFVDGFLTTSFTICIGAMAVVGSIQDGINGDYSILAIKAILDLIIVLVLTSTMGKGCIFSAIPIFVFQGSITLLARVIEPIMTDSALGNLSLVGSVLIFCVGINLVWDKKIPVANFLPAIVFAVIGAFIPVAI
ncbi:MAG: DUF554 domain-containing protein [Lachnospiraceae bacterium]|nr:DUF554 domain-containing protein [Candidatus Colinaster scatohippi]